MHTTGPNDRRQRDVRMIVLPGGAGHILVDNAFKDLG
jgi:hypothetical protein